MGLDTECDVTIEARDGTPVGESEIAATILGIRDRLLGEHLESRRRTVAAAVERADGSLVRGDRAPAAAGPAGRWGRSSRPSWTWSTARWPRPNCWTPNTPPTGRAESAGCSGAATPDVGPAVPGRDQWISWGDGPLDAATVALGGRRPRRPTRGGQSMRSDITPGGVFPDYALPDHTGTVRTLSELQRGDPLVLTLARGHYCPKEHQQHLELAAFQSAIAVAYTQIVDDLHRRPPHAAGVPRLGRRPVDVPPDPGRVIQKDLDIREYTDPGHDPMIPHTLVLKPGLVDPHRLQRLLVLGSAVRVRPLARPARGDGRDPAGLGPQRAGAARGLGRRATGRRSTGGTAAHGTTSPRSESGLTRRPGSRHGAGGGQAGRPFRGEQQQLPRGPAGLQVLVRPGRVGQRVPASDRDAQLPGGDPAEHLVVRARSSSRVAV